MANPVTREEIYLSAIADGEGSVPEPVTREEKFLAKIAGEDVETPEPITRKEKYLHEIAENGGGGGGSAVLINKNINANGTYNASSDNADGYKKVVVDVPNPSTGTLTIVENDTYDVTDYASVDVDVPIGITPSGTKSITANGTYNVTTYASADVNVEGWDPNQYAEGLVPPAGELTLNTATSVASNAFYKKTALTKISAPNVEKLYTSAFEGCDNVESFYLPKADFGSGATRIFWDCKKITAIALPSAANETVGQTFQNCLILATADLGNCYKISPNTFINTPLLRTLILRKSDDVVQLANWNANGMGGIYNNPSASTIYVPSALVSSYQTATNWSTAYGAGLTFSAIEGSIYETKYADGTPIGA